MQNCKILIVEDEKRSAHVLTDTLKKMGYSVLGCVTTDTEAIKKVEETEPDIILMDIRIKGNRNGIEVSEEIINRFNIPVVFITAEEDKKTINRAKLTGAYGYVIKPFDERELYSILEIALYKHEINTELQKAHDRLETIVKERTSNLEESVKKLQREIQERKKVEGALRRSQRKLKERSAEVEKLLLQKDEFINQLGHDLKTPLTPLVALLPKISEQINDPELRAILELNVTYMKNLVIKTVDLARLSSPSFELTYSDVNLHEILEDIIRNFNHLLEEYNIVVKNNVKKGFVSIADRVGLTEVMENLITNSIKYSNGDGGTITVNAKKTRNNVTVSVKDTGMGLTKKQLPLIFDEFYKADKSRHVLESTGLGLSICKRIIEKHGGNIWAESPGRRKGTTFYFTLGNQKEDK